MFLYRLNFLLIVKFKLTVPLLCVCMHSAWKGHPRNDLYCVGWDVKPYSLTQYMFGFTHSWHNVSWSDKIGWISWISVSWFSMHFRVSVRMISSGWRWPTRCTIWVSGEASKFYDRTTSVKSVWSVDPRPMRYFNYTYFAEIIHLKDAKLYLL